MPFIDQDINLALLQICSTPMGAELPSPAMMLFSRLIRGLLPQMIRESINVNSDNAQYEALKIHQKSMLRIVTLKKTLLFSL